MVGVIYTISWMITRVISQKFNNGEPASIHRYSLTQVIFIGREKAKFQQVII